MAKSPAKNLLKDPDVRRWHANMCRSSSISAGVRLRRLNLFCSHLDITPAALTQIGEKNPKELEDMLLDYVSWMEDQRNTPGYIDNVLKGIKSWLVYNRIQIKRKIRITDMGTTPTLRNEKVPDQEQLGKILSASTPRGRAIVSLMAFSGVRPQVMGTFNGGDGLRISDLPDLRIEGKEAKFAVIPAMIVVRREISKVKNQYITFLGREGCEHMLGYLRERLVGGEEIGPDSALITHERANHKDRRFMVTPSVSSVIRSAVRGVASARPYALRGYFDTQLLLAESNGCMTHAYRQFFMGHKGDMEARYTTNKGRLTDQMLDDMRRSYMHSEIFLSTTGSDSKMQARMKKALFDVWKKQAEMHGIDPESVIPGRAARPGEGAGGAQEPVGSAKDDTGGKEPAETRGPEHSESGRTASAPGHSSRIAADDDELVMLCSDGWELVRELPGGRFLMRRGKDGSGTKSA